MAALCATTLKVVRESRIMERGVFGIIFEMLGEFALNFGDFEV